MNKIQVEALKEWEEATKAARRVLRDWESWLFSWRLDLERGKTISDDEFMEAVQEMSEAGLDSWLDQHPLGIDQLRAALTTGGREE